MNTRRFFLAAMVASLAAPVSAAEDGPIKIGILNDQSGPYVAIYGPSSVHTALMAVEDFGGTVL